MIVLLNQVQYTVIGLTSERHPCGKYTTSFSLRNYITDITIVAEGTQEQVFERLGIKVQE